jgi:hypothetical protein
MGRGVGIGASLSFGFGALNRVEEVAMWRCRVCVVGRAARASRRAVASFMLDKVTLVVKSTSIV